MTLELMAAIAGVGLFLLGMVIFTEGLRELAAEGLRKMLIRFTDTPTKGAMAGAVATAVIQSSSATTVTAVGFVGAGLITFSQGLGIIFGANLGTTITGWMVALLGFKFQLGLFAMALLPIGVLMRLFAKGRARQAGWALAGFSLLFLGIDAMQQGMAGLEGELTPKDFPGDTFFGRLQLVGIGILITLVTQSSSAGVATALVALNAGAISLPQAAALVIGMDIGTTVTAALATIGGGTETRRTGFAHVIYNLMTGIFAFIVLVPFSHAATGWLAADPSRSAEVALVAFHSFFNLAGVIAVLPFAGAFARLIIWLFPEQGPQLTRRLEPQLHKDPAAAVDAAIATTRAVYVRTLASLRPWLLRPSATHAQPVLSEGRFDEFGKAIEATALYLTNVRATPDQPAAYLRYLAAIHALDHLQRLVHRCRQDDRLLQLHREKNLSRFSHMAGRVFKRAVRRPYDARNEALLRLMERRLIDAHRPYRARIIESAAARETGAADAVACLDSIRWLERVTHHVLRIEHHLTAAHATTKNQPASVLPQAGAQNKTAGAARSS